MTILSAIRNRLSPPSASPEAAGEAGALPFAGYDRLDNREVVAGMSDHSQVELEAVEAYEKSHKNREPVLGKLRYMRQHEPLPGYDALSITEILAALQRADKTTVKKVRDYERKFANRVDVLEEVTRVHHRLQVAEPGRIAPAGSSDADGGPA